MSIKKTTLVGLADLDEELLRHGNSFRVGHINIGRLEILLDATEVYTYTYIHTYILTKYTYIHT